VSVICFLESRGRRVSLIPLFGWKLNYRVIIPYGKWYSSVAGYMRGGLLAVLWGVWVCWWARYSTCTIDPALRPQF